VRSVSGHHPTSLLDLTPTLRQRWLVFSVAVLLLVGLGIAAPFSNVPLWPFPAAVIAQQAIVFVNDLITALLLFGQYSINRSRSLLVLAASYLFTGLIVVPHGLTFPNAFTQTGLLGAGLQSTAWMYFFWHWAPPLGILAYACLKNWDRAKTATFGAATAIGLSVAIVIGLVVGLSWLATGGERLLPMIFADQTRAIDPLALARLTAATFIIAAMALVVLWARRASVLDYWLMLVLWTLMLEQILVGLTDIRFAVGFYVGRGFSLLTSVFVLTLLLQQTFRLYVNLARANLALRREREARLLTADLLTATISHEIRQPLTALNANAQTSLRLLAQSPPDLEETRAALTDIVADGHRVVEVVSGIRAIVGKDTRQMTPFDINEVVRGVLQSVEIDLRAHRVATATLLGDRLPQVRGNRVLVEHVVLNLVTNAIEAMEPVTKHPREIRIRSDLARPSYVYVTVEDSGPGIRAQDQDAIFEPFFTTKARGTGMGLAICRSIIELHSGKLWVSSGRSRGACFHMELPVA
jgi:signal transduction histidine kinase